MSGKLALALFLALQVSVCLCDVPVPDKELVDKYNDLKATFLKRLMSAYGKAAAAIGPALEGSTRGAAAKEYIEDMQGNPKLQGAVKIATGVAGDMAPAYEKARQAALGYYSQYVRPHIGTYLDTAITHGKAVLDVVLPVE